MEREPDLAAVHGAGKRIRISIAMATYNGETYLHEQFESLFNQSRLPDEIVVYDDGSKDDTVGLLRSLKLRAPFPVHIIVGTQNVGVNAAFGIALAACRGEYFFFCDQDDIWEPEKISQFMCRFEEDDAVGLVFCDASQIDSDGNSLSKSLWKQILFDKKRRLRFERRPMAELLRGGNFVYGMAAACRADCVRPFLPVDGDYRALTHDTWFALHAVGAGWTGVAVNDRLVRYRRHHNQTTKSYVTAKTMTKDARIAARAELIGAEKTALERVRVSLSATASVRSEPPRAIALQELSAKISYLGMRRRLLGKRDHSLALRASISPGYWRYAKGPLSVLRDLWGL